MADNTLSEKNGGKWALSGFFYQTVGVASLVARAHNLREQGLDGDDLDAMVEIGGLVPESSYDQDAILFPVNGMLQNQCAFYQFKYSGAESGTKLTATSFREIVTAFVKGTRRATSDHFTVFRYVLVTNREISGSIKNWIANHAVDDTELKNIVDLLLGDQAATCTGPERVQIENEVKSVLLHFHPPVTSASLSHFWRDLTLYGERLGLSRDLIFNGIRNLMADQFIDGSEGIGKCLDRQALNRSLAGCENPCELTVASIKKKYPLDVSPLFPGDLNRIVDRKSVADQLNSLIAGGKQLIVLTGRGGTGKSSYLSKWVVHSLYIQPEAIVTVKHASCLSDNWIAKTVADWSGVLLFANSSNTDALRRLLLANGNHPHKLYLILDGIDETSNDSTNNVRKLLDEFYKSPNNAVLIATCRDERWLENLLEPTGGALKNDLKDMIVTVDFFDNEEFSELVMSMKDSVAKDKLLQTVFSNVSATFLTRPGFKADGSNSVSFGDALMGIPGPTDWETELFHSFHHPVLWNIFVQMGDKSQEELINNMPTGYSCFGHGIVAWFTKKLNLRHAGQPFDKIDITQLIQGISQNTKHYAVFDRKIWIDNSRSIGWEPNTASLIYREAISSGLIEPKDEEKWRWTNQLICKSFAALSAGTRVETL